jgi:hypothetical protein
MSEQLVGEMDQADFDRMIEAFVDRPTGPDDAIPAELVFAMLDKVERSERVQIESEIVGDRLVLSTPPDMVLPATIHEIEVKLPGVRVVVKREPVPA